VGVAGHVDRHAHHVGGEVAAVVEVEAAQEVLVGLAVPECWVTIMPGTVSSASAGRSRGRLRSWAAVTVPSLAESATPMRSCWRA
jgi:hypothetical protein